MDRSKTWRAPLAAALLLSLLSGCSSTSESGKRHGYVLQPGSAQGPFCEHSPFGEHKRGDVEKTVAIKADEPLAIGLDDRLSEAGKLLFLNHPLDSAPPEITRIRRGLVNRFTGKFIKDGLYTWSAVDLDRLMAVYVERRVFDLRAHQSRAVSDPVFTHIEQLSFARKWSDRQRTELEVIDVFPIALGEAQSFVCEANRIWVDKRPLPEEEDVSGQMSDGAADVFLLDYRQQQGVSYKFRKTVEMTETMANIFAAMWQHAPQGPSW
jgi:hypothetical protein